MANEIQNVETRLANPWLVLLAVIGTSSGTTGIINWANPANDGDRWTGSQHVEYAAGQNLLNSNQDRRLDSLDVENIRLWKDIREHKEKSQHDGAHYRMSAIEQAHRELRARIDRLCGEG